MNSQKSTIFHLIIGLIAIGLLASCSDSNTDAGWDLDEPEPRAVIDASLCADMPNRDLSTPLVTPDGKETWRIRYPLYEEGCGAFQLDAVINFAAVPPEERIYLHEISVCNRCDSAQTWNYLYEIRRADSDDANFELEVPQEPHVQNVSGLLPAGMPVVEHRMASEARNFRVCAQLSTSRYDGGVIGSQRPTFVSYAHIYSMPIESGETTMQATYYLRPRDFQSLAMDLLAGQPDEDRANRTAIYWPILAPLGEQITGATAASGAEFCASFLPRYDFHPYPGEYDPFDKYTRQDVPAAQLPPELITKLQTFVEIDLSSY